MSFNPKIILIAGITNEQLALISNSLYQVYVYHNWLPSSVKPDLTIKCVREGEILGDAIIFKYDSVLDIGALLIFINKLL